jgi:PAS domain S-box-containing protein
MEKLATMWKNIYMNIRNSLWTYAVIFTNVIIVFYRKGEMKKDELVSELNTARKKIEKLKAKIARVTAGQRKTTKTFEEKESCFQSLFETMAQGVVYQTASGEIALANPAAERILGLSLDEMQGQKSVDRCWRAIHEDGSNFPGKEHPPMVALRTGSPVRDVVMGIFHPRTGEYRWIVVDAVPEFYAGETHPYQVYTTFTDITERKVAKETLLKSEARFRNYFELPLAGRAITAPDGSWLDVNTTLCNLLGYTREELMQTTWSAMVSSSEAKPNHKFISAPQRRRMPGSSPCAIIGSASNHNTLSASFSYSSACIPAASIPVLALAWHCARRLSNGTGANMGRIRIGKRFNFPLHLSR